MERLPDIAFLFDDYLTHHPKMTAEAAALLVLAHILRDLPETLGHEAALAAKNVLKCNKIGVY